MPLVRTSVTPELVTAKRRKTPTQLGELVAEIGSCYVCRELGVPATDHDQSHRLPGELAPGNEERPPFYLHGVGTSQQSGRFHPLVQQERRKKCPKQRVNSSLPDSRAGTDSRPQVRQSGSWRTFTILGRTYRSPYETDTNDGDVPIGATGRGRPSRSSGGSASAIKQQREPLPDCAAAGGILLPM